MSDNMQEDIEFLFETIAKIQNAKDCRALFNDLCTYKEIDAMAQRLRSAQLLSSGATYEQVIKQTDISSATLSRVSKSLKFGNGYKNVLK